MRVLDERVVIFDPADTSAAHCKGVPDHFRRSRDQRYIFDRVFDPFSSQDEIYEHTAKVRKETLPLASLLLLLLLSGTWPADTSVGSLLVMMALARALSWMLMHCSI